MPLPPYTQYFIAKLLVRVAEYIDSEKSSENGAWVLKAKVGGIKF
jgi:hypothetical protein